MLKGDRRNFYNSTTTRACISVRNIKYKNILTFNSIAQILKLDADTSTTALPPPPNPPLTFYLIYSGLILILNFLDMFYFLGEDAMLQIVWWPWWSKHKEMSEDTFELKKTGQDLRKVNTKK